MARSTRVTTPSVTTHADSESTADGRPGAGFWLFAGHLWTVWGLALSNICLGATILWGLLKRGELGRGWRHGAPLFAPLGLYMLFLTVSALGSLDPRVSLGELKEIFSLATLVLAVLLVRHEGEVRRVVDGLLIVVTLLAAHGIWQNYYYDYGTLHKRIVGLFSHYQTLAGILLLGQLLLIGRMVAGNGRRRPWHGLALVLITWALLLTLTRGAWVAVILTLGLLVLFLGRHRSRYVAGGLVLALAFGVLAPDSWTERMRSIVDLRDPSNYDRLCMAEASFYMISERPLFGIGPEMVSERYPIYRHPTAPRFDVPHLHNTFLQLAAEQGLLSLAAYAWLMLVALALAHRGYRAGGGFRGPRADLYLGVLLVVVGFNLAGLFEDNWRDTEVQRWILFLLAVPCGLPEATHFQNDPDPVRVSSAENPTENEEPHD